MCIRNGSEAKDRTLNLLDVSSNDVSGVEIQQHTPDAEERDHHDKMWPNFVLDVNVQMQN